MTGSAAALALFRFETQASLAAALLLAARVAWTRDATHVSIKTHLVLLLVALLHHGDVFLPTTWPDKLSNGTLIMDAAVIGLPAWTVFLLAQPSVKVGNIKNDAFPYEYLILASFVCALIGGGGFGTLTLTWTTRAKGRVGAGWVLLHALARASLAARYVLFAGRFGVVEGDASGGGRSWGAAVVVWGGVALWVDFLYVYFLAR
ncbi:hypothetical protein DFJ73DRAFT_765717 [Zopfochytrium polystomum]|nr:hypothetical protein DFJ73DRAFT_765717 [Zopfochytrium polystomum]